MKAYLKYIALVLFTAFPVVAGAQKSTMRLHGDEWDFGRIRETDGPVRHTFTFTNTGKRAFVIENVIVNCGCTVPTFSKEPVLPGGKGEITVRYDPAERPGTFIQDVRIISDGGRNNNKVRIRGEVIPRPRSVEEDYPFVFSGGMRFSTLSLYFGMIGQGEVRSMAIGYANTSDRDVRLEFAAQPARDFMTISAPVTVPPGGRGDVTVTFDLRGVTFYGRYSDHIYPVVDGRKEMMPFAVTYTAIDSRDGVKLDKAPGILLEPVYHDFGNAAFYDRLTCEAEIANDGADTLIVRWLSRRPYLTTTLAEGTRVAPGGRVAFTVTLDVAKMGIGIQTGALTIVTNDPLRPVRDMIFVANVR